MSNLTLLEPKTPKQARDEKIQENHSCITQSPEWVVEAAQGNPQACWKALFHASEVMQSMARIIRATYNC